MSTRRGGKRSGGKSGSGFADSDSDSAPSTSGPELVDHGETIKGNMDQEMRDYLELQEVLSEVGLDEELEVPCIVVVGDQSAGKSTVLELISGITLPRGTNIVTRCPIAMTMRNEPFARIDISYKSLSGEEKVSENVAPSEVETFLRNAQRKSIPEDQAIGHNEIKLKICGPTVPNMTIVDLPGLNYSETNLTKEIKKLIQHYIQRPSTVIVLVHACTADISSTEATQLARNVDPNFERTMCVLTHPDLVTETTRQNDVMYLAKNKHDKVKFKRGFIVVKGKGSDQTAVSIDEARESEREFFANHPTYRELVSLKIAGTDNLIRLVSQIVYNNARKNLPILVGEVRRMHREAVEKKKSYPIIFEDDMSKVNELANIIFAILADFDALSKEETDSNICEDYHLCCCANSAYEEFARNVLTKLIPSNNLYEEIRNDVIRHRGPEPRGFPRYAIYRNRVERKMREMHIIALDCLSRVEIVVGTCLKAIIKNHAKFALLRPLTDMANTVFEAQKNACKDFIDTLFEMEVKPYISDYNFKNVPLYLTKDKHRYELLPTILTEICESFSDSVSKKPKRKKFFRSMKGLLASTNPGKQPIVESFIDNVQEKMKDDTDTDGEDDSQPEPSIQGDLGVPHSLPGAPPTEFPYPKKAIEEYVDDSVQATLDRYYKYTYNASCQLLDTIPKTIQHHLITSLYKKLSVHLNMGAQELQACMQEDPQTASERAEVNSTLAVLERVLNKCHAFDSAYVGGPSN